MWIFLSVMSALSLWAAVASVVVAMHDGYRQVPTRAAAGVTESKAANER
ncbi:MAG: hypothetical protein JWM51_714 [Microbacteriaceae bacterium]|jgi:hypothetical protein|nr:hypothetical protein [Microbacteriaceae bacterium]